MIINFLERIITMLEIIESLGFGISKKLKKTEKITSKIIT
jgi:hypothetical protein